MAPHAEQLQHINELPEFASTSLSADFIKSSFLLNADEREDAEFSKCRS